MRSFTTILVGLCALALLLPAAAQAQCPNTVAITCGELANGDSTGGTNDLGGYSCVGGSTGPDVVYELQLASDATVTAVMTPDAFDATLALLPADCDVGACIDGSDVGGSSGAETVSADLTAGTYHIVADGYYADSEGAFTLEVMCENCVDADGDGYNAYDAVDCMSGLDCDDGDAAINPDADEVCDDGIDNNCSGFDMPCDPVCSSAETISSGDVVSGNNGAAGSTPGYFDAWACISGVYSYPGTEYTYEFVPQRDCRLTVMLQPTGGYDSALALLEDAGSGCVPASCVAGDDSYGSPEVVTYDVTSGMTYFIVVDGYDEGSGDYDLSVICEVCVDADGDGFEAFDEVDCPSGLDCNDEDPNINPDAEEICDDGIDQDCDGEDAPCCVDVDGDGYEDEACGGTDCDDTDPAINPDAWEICDDGIDQDCDGSDAACPACTSSATFDCDNNNSGSVDLTTDGSADNDDYCGGLGAYFGIDWSGPEYIFDFTPGVDTAVEFATTDQDIIVLRAYNQNTCNPGRCVTYGGESFQGQPPVNFLALAGEKYWISVDQPSTAVNDTFDWSVSCLPEQACSPSGESLVCDSSTSGNNTGADNNVDTYRVGWPMPGGEVVYDLTVPYDGEVTATITMPGGADLALFVLEDDGSGDCLPRNAIDFSDEYQTVGDEPEIVTFQAAAGTNYFVVVDAWDAAEQGAFNLTVETTLDCGEWIQCDCECYDDQNDVSHCGDCDTVCAFDNATPTCNAGSCEMGACDANFGDCNTDPVDGCEINHLNDNDYCGDCNTACSGATPYCVGGVCTDQCPGDLTNCGGVCVDLQTDVAHCGACDQACALDNVDDQACVAATCEIVACTDGWADCDTEHATGCEVELGTLDNCSGCGDACEYDNGTAACTDGACELTACDDGYADCDGDPDNGCEVTLGTIDNCTDCGDICAYDNASAVCTVDGCALDTCDANYGDCNGDAVTDGCETMLNTSAACGACDVACGPLEGCAGDDVNGYACTATCLDGDGDGFADAECGGPDCDDEDANVNPGVDETCNGADDDCDGAIDEGFDADGDGYKSCGAEADCDDSDPDVNPGATEICQDGLDNDCSGGDAECTCPDADKDGYQDASCAEANGDCDDADVNVNPGAVEICNEMDDDCDGEIDEDDVCDSGTNSGCDCSTGGSQRPVASGLLLLALVLGLALPRRRNS